MINIVIRNAYNPHKVILAAGTHVYLVPNLYGKRFRKLCRNDHAAVVKRYGRAAVMQVYALGHASRRFNAQQMHAALASAAVFAFHLGIEAEHNRIKIVVCRVFAEQLLHIGKRHGLIHICLHVHLPNVAELLFDYAEY